jgi:hypothetical protein
MRPGLIKYGERMYVFTGGNSGALIPAARGFNVFSKPC